MSVKPSKNSKTIRKKRVSKVQNEVAPKKETTPSQTDTQQQASEQYPPNQRPVPIPPIDRKTVEGVEKLMELSYLGYMRELRKADMKDDCVNIEKLNAILSEYVGPYLLIGYLPDNEPVEVLYAPTPKDKEAVLERLRKTFIRHMNANTPG
jgi:hypothetical protein